MPPLVKKILVLDGILVLLVLWWINPLAGQQSVATDGWVRMIPSARVDSRVQCQDANNNLDAIAHNGRYYTAFRTAPSHFASEDTRLYIVSSADLDTWEFEHEIHLGYDMREPRFAILQDTLRMYFFEGGKKRLRFEPRKLWVTTLRDGQWSGLRNLGLDGYVNWRLRERSDTLYLSAYYGKELYAAGHQGDLRLFQSTDGYNFEPISESAQVAYTGAEEGEFLFDSKGHLWGTVRLEGSGGMIVHADAHALHDWKTRISKYKFDSALLFEHDGEIYLIARRNMDGISQKTYNRMYNLLRYSLTRKKTALYKIDREQMDVLWIMDFPSTGDTAFPGIIPLEDGTYFVLNYSSDITGKERNWIRGQLGKTYIYSTILDMSELPEPRPLDEL